MNFEITPLEYAEARNQLCGIVVNGTGNGLMKDFYNAGEDLTPGNKATMMLLGKRKLGRFFITKLLSAAGMGRAVQCLKNLRFMTPEEYECLMRDRYTFAYQFSKKWQDSGISALVTPIYPHCSFKAS